jgi:hypothetical protein
MRNGRTVILNEDVPSYVKLTTYVPQSELRFEETQPIKSIPIFPIL